MDKKKRIVIASGSSVLGNTSPEQMVAAKITVEAIVDPIEEDYEVIVAHSDGPQVGMIDNAMAALSREDVNQSNTLLSVCVAMSQAYIGHDLQNALREELLNRNIDNIPVTAMIIQVRMDENDPASRAPPKLIGHLMTTEQVKEAEEKYGYIMKEDSGRGYRHVVAPPKPTQIIEVGAIHSLMDSGQLVIAYGGGGIPVTLEGSHLRGTSAVTDRDSASELLAEESSADFPIIPTVVEKTAINYGKSDVKWLSDITTDEARQYIEEEHFAPGSMLPEIQATVRFTGSKEGCISLIILFEKAKEGIQRPTGTKMHR